MCALEILLLTYLLNRADEVADAGSVMNASQIPEINHFDVNLQVNYIITC